MWLGPIFSSKTSPLWQFRFLQKNHIYTSGASGTNAAVIRGALRAERPELLTVILPQSLKKQPPESQELLSKVSKTETLLRCSAKSKNLIGFQFYLWNSSPSLCNSQVKNVVEKPHNDHLPLLEASRFVKVVEFSHSSSSSSYIGLQEWNWVSYWLFLQAV